MSTFEDGIWTHLVNHHGADRVDFREPTPPKRSMSAAATAAGAMVLVAVVAIVVLVLGASSGTPPAYALTQNRGGSYTVSIYDVSRAIPALNAKFAQIGIRVTVVPVVAGCTASSFDPVEAIPGSISTTVTVSNRNIPAGWRGYIAAERLANGRVALAQGQTPRPIPSCFATRLSHGIPAPAGIDRRRR